VSTATRVLRAMPALLRVGFAEAVAYRAEFLIWILSTTMPFIMLVLWTAVARDAPVGRFDESDFVAYFLATFIVRQLIGSWVAWEMNWEVRHGSLAVRLLRPIPPIIAYASEAVAATPLRVVACIPVAILALFLVGTEPLPRDPLLWAAFGVALVGAFAITFLAGFAIGCLAFFVESSAKVMGVWLALFSVFSGYLVPVELFPPWLAALADALPFRYQLALPVELLTSAHDRAAAASLVGRQWLFVGLHAAGAAWLWRAGVRRFAAYGG
jgi:ABC-2 type transport system permease protein